MENPLTRAYNKLVDCGLYHLGNVMIMLRKVYFQDIEILF